MTNLLDMFDAVYVINIDSRTDRLEQFVSQLKAIGLSHEYINKKISRFSAIVPSNADGRLGCIMSHIAILRDAKTMGLKNVLVLEDDAMFVGDASREDLKKIAEQLCEVKWDIFYMGYNSHIPLYKVSDNLLEIKSCYSTHAIAYNASSYDYLISAYDRGDIHILDVWLSDNMQQPGFKCVGAYPIQFSQFPGMSDIEKTVVNYDFIMDRFYENTKHLK